MEAFAQLTAEGYLFAVVGRGSFVAAELPEDRLPTQKRKSAQLTSVSPEQNTKIELSNRGRLLAQSPFRIQGRDFSTRAFRPSQPDLAAFPFALWSKLASRRHRRARGELLADGEAQGYRPLRDAIADHVRTSRGIGCSGDNIVILGSVQQAIDLTVRLLLDPGDTAIVEDPGYPGGNLVFAAAGARVIGVPVDSEGIDVALARQTEPGARLIYVTAGRQAPLGPTLSLERRLALLSWAKDTGMLILEDDYDSEFRFEGRPLAALKSLDTLGHVIYCGTFSKLLFPALRIAYAVVPDRLVDAFVAALSLSFRYVAIDQQSILHAFIAEGHLGRHVRRMRLLYGERAQALEQAIHRRLGGMLHLPPITMGLDTPAFLNAGANDSIAWECAASAGIETRPLSYYSFRRSSQPGLVLGFAAVDVDAIHEGVDTLAAALEKSMSGDLQRGETKL